VKNGLVQPVKCALWANPVPLPTPPMYANRARLAGTELQARDKPHACLVPPVKVKKKLVRQPVKRALTTGSLRNPATPVRSVIQAGTR
jgi:hypothetical protein